MKIIGLIFMFMSCIYAALIKINGMKNYLLTMTVVSDCVVQIKNGLATKNDSLPDLFKRLSEECSGDARHFFSVIDGLMSEIGIRSLFEIWNEALKLCFPLLSEDDLHNITKLGQSLGKCDTASQIDDLSMCQSYFIEKIEKLRNELPEKRKLTLGLWASTGAMAVILLI